jgi:dCTP deaminase
VSTATRRAAEPEPAGLASKEGVLPSQAIREAISSEWITAGEYRIPRELVQPASLDLRLGPIAWALRCSFLPDSGSTVEEKRAGISYDEIDLRDGATLERDRPYLVPLIEHLRLPPDVRAKTNPKSSTGRLDVFTRVMTDRNNRFDEITAGYEGKLYLEVVPRSFAIKVKTGLSLNQLRLLRGNTQLNDDDIGLVHDEHPLLYKAHSAVRGSELQLADGLFLSLNIDGLPGSVVGYKAKQNTFPIDLTSNTPLKTEDYWELVHPEHGKQIVLQPDVFYLLISAEGVSIPPGYAAEMLAYDPTAGELRTHYAGFFDPGFGYSTGAKKRYGSRAALEVRARDVPFMVEHLQPVCKLAFERMAAIPDVLYGRDLGSNYQGQENMLSKYFADQTAGGGQMPLGATGPPLDAPGSSEISKQKR